ncbi:MAG: hypothetical protein LBK73_07015 [Treponema sp.]|jgi:hypothetical protein|nr:hypothetical protein [Treponema sp.]
MRTTTCRNGECGSEQILEAMGNLQETTSGVKNGAGVIRDKRRTVIEESETFGRITESLYASAGDGAKR